MGFLGGFVDNLIGSIPIIGDINNAFGDSGPSGGNAFTDGASLALTTAATTIETSSAGAFLSIAQLIRDASQTVKDIISPIADVVHTVAQTVQDINDNIIKPIVQPIQAIFNTTQSLIKVLQGDLSNGIKGLLQVGQDITNAVTGIDAVMQRTVAQLGAANAKVLTDNMVPAMKDAGATPLLAIHDYYKASVTAFDTFANANKAVRLTEPHTADSYLSAVNDGLDWLYAQDGILQAISKGLVLLADIIPMLEAKREPALEVVKEQIHKASPTGKLGAGDVSVAFMRGILSLEQSLDEIQLQNFSADRARVLLDLARVMLGATDLIQAYRRGLIDVDGLNARLSQIGYIAEDAALTEQISWLVPDTQTILNYFHRGLLNEDDSRKLMRANGITDDEASRAFQASTVLAGINDVIHEADRAPLIAANVAQNSLNSPAPQRILEAGNALGLSGGATQTLWSNHYQVLPPSLAVQAFFRGVVDHNQLDALLSAAAIAPEQRQNFIDLQRPLIPFRTIPGMLAAGVFDEIDARLRLEAHGYTAADAVALIDYSLGKSHNATPAADTALHGLTQGTVVKLYSAGTIDRTQAHGYLTSIGLSAQAADLALTLDDLNQQHAERQAETDLILAEADAGVLTFEQAQGQLAQLGLTAVETRRALTKILRAQRKATKLPSESQLASMWKHGIIDGATFKTTLLQLGFSEQWAQALVALAGAPPTPKAGVTA